MTVSSADARGLTTEEVVRRRAEFGVNEIDKPRTRSLWAILRGVLREPMFMLLLVGAGVYLAIGDLGEGLFLTAGAAVSMGLVIIQEARSEGALRALRSLAQPMARVVRDGVDQQIAARDLVPGDLVLLEEGERLPADVRLVSGDLLSVDESMLTGESAPVAKHRTDDPADETGKLFAGAMIARGGGVAEVIDTGARTVLGKIGASLAAGGEEPTPLQQAAHRVVGYLAIAALAFCVVVFLAYGLLRGDWLMGGLTSITVAISLLPEEFPMVLAVFLALGAWRLARHNVLVRRSAVIEALGGATMLCVDKTGTLTRNRMQLARAWAGDSMHDLDDDRQRAGAVARMLRIAALASARRSLDPMDRAILDLAPQPDDIPSHGPDRTWPLKPERLAVIQVWRHGEGEIAAAKGAPETVFRMCRLPPERIEAQKRVLDDMAAEGLRVLAVASSHQDRRFPDEPEDGDFQFEGLIGFIDPLREDAPAALAEARSAGIDVAMITGDHPSTALAIARQAGVSVAAGALAGADIDALDDAGLRQRIRAVRVFARIRPEQKLRLVDAFKANGEVVVMTGDGVNDGPALQAAHIGIAMGKRGTDVAREASDIVLLDDSFASIVGGVRLGRRIFANLRKALTFITAVHVPLAGLALGPILLGWPPLFLPMHVVLLELVIDPVCSLVFEAEPSESHSMQKPPRRKDEPLFGPSHIAFGVLQGAIVLLAVAGVYGWALQAGEETQARGAAFCCLVVANLTMAMADAAGGRAGLFDRSHAAFWSIAAAAAAALATTLYLPVLSDILKMTPPPLAMLGVSLGVAVIAGGWFGAAKALRGMRPAQRAV